MTRLDLRLDGDAPYEAGAALLTALAWPEMIDDADAMGKRHAALCQMYVTAQIECQAARAETDPSAAVDLAAIKPLYLTQPHKWVSTFDDELHRQLDDRMMAARVAIPFLRQAAGLPVQLPPGVKRLSLDQITNMVLDDKLTREKDVKNFQARVWRPSRPVIHIASAIAVTLDHAERQGVGFTVGDLFLRSNLIADVVRLSGQYAELIPAITTIDMQPDKLIHLAIA